MLVQSIYYRRIGSEATERLLERFGHEGSFLLRDSETVQGAYCLCVRKAPFVHTYRLVHSADGWCLQDSRVRLQRFRTLETLIESYRRAAASDVSMPPLTDPLDKTQLRYISPRQEFVYMETCSSGSSSWGRGFSLADHRLSPEHHYSGGQTIWQTHEDAVTSRICVLSVIFVHFINICVTLVAVKKCMLDLFLDNFKKQGCCIIFKL